MYDGWYDVLHMGMHKSSDKRINIYVCIHFELRFFDTI